MNLRTLAVLVLPLLLAACGVPSLHPLHDANTVLDRDSRYAGTWVKKDAKPEEVASGTIVVREAAKEDGEGAAGAYIVTMKNKDGAPIDFQVHPVTLGSHTFVSVAAHEKIRKRGDEDHYRTMLPVYQIGKVNLKQDGEVVTMSIGFLEQSVLKKLLAEKKAVLATAEGEGGVMLITAPSKDLAAFVKAHAEDAGLFEQGSVYVKR